MDWIDPAQDGEQWRVLVNTVMNLRFPQNAGKFLSGCTTGGFSQSTQLHGVKPHCLHQWSFSFNSEKQMYIQKRPG
jgi:hypothetical protein